MKTAEFIYKLLLSFAN